MLLVCAAVVRTGPAGIHGDTAKREGSLTFHPPASTRIGVTLPRWG